MVTDAVWAVIRIEFDGEQEWFGGYVAVDAAGEVLEKSDTYGMFEGEADDFPGPGDPECIPATRAEFVEAWGRPYAERSLRRRFLARLNGASDWNGDPSERDAEGSGERPEPR
jgi:hypothetical protein